ncbi:MAG: hypothetical protein ACE5H4_05165 [Candidatus Thorarchaeota archaeon]
MGGVAKGASVLSTLLLMYLAFDVLNRYVNTVEFQLQEMTGSLWAFFTGVTPMNTQVTLMLMIVVLGVVAIGGALKG